LPENPEKVDDLKANLKGATGELFSFQGDVSKTEDVEKLISWVEQKFGAVHVLINNAGIGSAGSIIG